MSVFFVMPIINYKHLKHSTDPPNKYSLIKYKKKKMRVNPNFENTHLTIHKIFPLYDQNKENDFKD